MSVMSVMSVSYRSYRVRLREATLEDVFLELTGRGLLE